MFGGIVLGGGVLGAYYFNQQQWKEQSKVNESAISDPKDQLDLPASYKDLHEDTNSLPQSVLPNTPESDLHRAGVPAQEENKTLASISDDIAGKGETEPALKEDIAVVVEKVPSSTESSNTFDNRTLGSEKSLDQNVDMKSTEIQPSLEQHVETGSPSIETLVDAPSEGNELNVPHKQQTALEGAEDALSIGVEQSSTLLDEYNLNNQPELNTPTLSAKHEAKKEDSSDNHVNEDGKLVLDFLQAIHAAEKRQAELDAHIFAEEKRKLKEKYDKELKDARIRELRYAEEAAIMDKELNKEKLKAAAVLKSLREELEKKREMEMERKEAEAEIKLKKVEELSKAELAAAIASEKASNIEKMAEADLHINALCMAFYARSEEARQSDSVHKLALGALALEDALSKGLPIKKEIDTLNIYLGSAKDPLLDVVLASLPQETWDKGSDTILQLKNEFDALKGSVRHFSLIPPSGGGLLAHSLARLASALKVRETDTSGDGIESLMNKVESFLADGKLSEAADTLENGVKGTQAAEVIGDWLRRTRNRAITEQALTLVQSYAISVGLA